MDPTIHIVLFFFILSYNSLLVSVTAVDTIAVNQTIKDGQTIVSDQETFELGFFSLGNNTQNRYLGIRYNRLAAGTVAWIANRESPIRNKSGELTLHSDGVLVLRDSATNTIIWSSNSPPTTGNLVARLLDNGNFKVFNDENGPNNYVWQTYDHTGNTFLPGVRFGRDLERGVVRNVTSWKSVDDPSQGPFMVYWDFNGYPQIFQKNGDVIQFRLGIWNGLGFTGMPASFKPNPIFKLHYVSNEIEISSYFDLIDTSVLSRMTLSSLGDMSWWNWINRTQGWVLYLSPTVDNCVRYGLCGVYGSCDIEQSPSCGCLKGFIPKNPDQWDTSDWTSGCRREIVLDCVAGDGFRKYSNVKLPDTRQSWFDRNMTLEQCEVKCRNECNCTAYTTLDIKDNIGCLLWYDELIDMRIFTNGQDIYIRMAAAEIAKDKKVSNKKIRMTVIAIPLTVGLAILVVICVLIIKKKKMQKPKKGVSQDPVEQKDTIDLPLFNLSQLLMATNNFSFRNKVGEGGFGPVYKGLLEDGQEIAVKRLSANSSQGTEEFKNEVLFISKLQHRNLVRILGCCVEGQERMLIYEYMPNKGLDLFIFDESTESERLNWSQRFHIINGIARGLLYLHQDSRLRIIHRDLKAANILLDHDMNPKISDFGLARSFGGNETETNTKRVVGTYGYMSPEYAGDGIFSVKSDIFSFGVLVLEIVSGKKNRGFIHVDHNHNLLGHAWRLHKEGKTLELVDTSLFETDDIFQVLLAIHVGLLCVQQNPGDRPNMATVVMMLSSDGQLPEPKPPGFYTEGDRFAPVNSSSIHTKDSNNEVTITSLSPR